MMEPLWDEVGVYIPNLKAIIENGTYISFKKGEEQKCLGRVLSNKQNGQKIVLHEYEIDNSNENVSTIGSSSYTTLHLKPTKSTVAIEPEDVVEIIFVFHRDAIDDGTFVTEGRKNCFKSMENCATFPCQVSTTTSQSYSKSIWIHTERIRVGCRHVLSSTSQAVARGSIVVFKISLSPDAYNYIKRNSDGAVASVMRKPARKYTREIFNGGATQTKRRAFELIVVSYCGQSGTDSFASVFGISAIIGVARKKDRVDQPPNILRQNDCLHYLANATVANATIEFCPDLNEATIRIRYKASIYMAEPVANVRLLSFINYGRSGDGEGEGANGDIVDEFDNIVFEDARLMVDGVLYEVVGIHPSNQTCTVQSSNSTLELSFAETFDLCKEYSS